MTILSGVQPSGELTLGNYLGALKKFKESDKNAEKYYSIVNLHAMTTTDNSKELYKNTLSIAAWYIALGLHETGNLFIQSKIKEHTELMWILGNLATVGELNRMTQFKSKSKGQQSAKSTLFTYPILMAADILLYDVTHVPVGSDQKQHLELTRDLATKFNNNYGETFVLCEPQIPAKGARIMSLIDPLKKMSKSDENPKSKILLTDSEKEIRKKIKSATTDSLGEINYDEEKQPGVSNLITIYAVIKEQTIKEATEYFKGQNYGFLKEEVANAIVEELMPLQEKYFEILKDESMIMEHLNKGEENARKKAQEKMQEIKGKVGLF